MNTPHMLYQSPGQHKTEGYTYEYIVVDESEIAAKQAEGWHLTLPEAHAATQQAAADKLAANEAEQRAIEEKLAKPPRATKA